MSFYNIDRQMQLIEGLPPQCQIPERHFSAPYTDLELFSIEILDVHAQEAVKQRRNKSFKHLLERTL